MADGTLCAEDANAAPNVNGDTLVKTCESGDGCTAVDTRNGTRAIIAHFPYSNGGILQKLRRAPSNSPYNLDIIPVCGGGGGVGGVGGVLDEETMMQSCSPNTEEDCRKKRCVDRYDSSESSDSGVAVLSCTDCSASSTASSDITDPGSPYSTASNHSDQDSNNPTPPTTTSSPNANRQQPQPPPAANKAPPPMPPMTQLQSSAHHPPWHWAEDSSPPLKRPPNGIQSPLPAVTSTPISKSNGGNICVNNNKMPPAESLLKAIVANSKAAKMQQGKITEYFKSHHKPKEFLALVDNIKREKKNGQLTRSVPPPGKVAIEKLAKPRKAPTITTPRKILPAPSRVLNQQSDHLVNNLTNITNLATQFPTQTMTLTTLTFPTATYIQTNHHKAAAAVSAARPHDQMFIPQFANQFVHHPHHQAISNYIKINVPIVKLNTIATPAANMTALDAGSPTVLCAAAATRPAPSHLKAAHAQIGGGGGGVVALAAVTGGGCGVDVVSGSLGGMQTNGGLSLSGSSLSPNAFTTTSSTNIGSSSKKKCNSSNNSNSLINSNSSSSSSSSNNKKSACSVAGTISAPLASATLLTPPTLPINNNNSSNNVGTTTITTASTQSSISVTVSDISSKISASTLINASSLPSSTSTAMLPSISNVKELSTSNNSRILAPTINNVSSPLVILHNQTFINNKASKTSQDKALISSNASIITAPINGLTLSKQNTDDNPTESNCKTAKNFITPAADEEEISPRITAAIKEKSLNNSASSSSARSSPVDSEDSGISLSSSLSTLTSLSLPLEMSPSVAPCQKSPILSVPKTIRFPAAAGMAVSSTASANQFLGGKPLKKRKSCVVGGGTDACRNGTVCSAEKRALLGDGVVPCMWSECHAQFEASGALLEHLQIKHVISQATSEHYVCLWQGCKVHGRKSCSRSWLERHVLAHAGTKPFRCIVDGCGMRFNSQLTLQRHVNGHFNGDQNQNGTSKKSVENALKLYKRNGKKIRFRRQPWSARMFDFIDASIMEGLQYQLVKMTEKRTLGQYDSSVGNTVLLQTQVLGRRVQVDGVRQLLVRYHPKDILPDEWIKEDDFSHTKTVKISALNTSAKGSLHGSLFSTTETTARQNKKHRRKPVILKST